MVDAKNFYRFEVCFNILHVIFGYIVDGIIEKCKSNDHTCLFKCTNISRVYGSSLNPRPAASGSKASGSNNFLEPQQMLMHLNKHV